MGRRVWLVATIALILEACSSAGGSTSGTPGAPSPSGVPAANLTVYAAASLKSALARAKSAYESAHPGTTLTISTDSSAALETQIEQGAPADVFLSADTANPRKLFDKGLAGGGLVTFARNELAIIVPRADPAGITAPGDLARSGVRIIAAGDAVPITRYANQLVANLGRQPGYPPDFAARYAANIVSREDNVAAVIAKIELGEGDAGICYVTDARTSAAVKTIEVPPSANVPATYAGVVVKASRNEAAASAFLAWFAGPAGQAILSSLGFLPPP